jgi:acyl CoA:acetate/3-ketoacid CoA transferase beta subunit
MLAVACGIGTIKNAFNVLTTGFSTLMEFVWLFLINATLLIPKENVLDAILATT